MVKVIVGLMGSSPVNVGKQLASVEGVKSFLSTVSSHHPLVTELDTARAYQGGSSEALLGDADAGKTFKIATKAPAFGAGTLSAAKIAANSAKSHEALKMDKIDIYYLHGPDETTSYEEQAKAMNELYKQGKFERFGVSNIPPEDVQEIFDICKRENYVTPSIYQGQWSPIARNSEGLLPVLRKLGIAFYAFSPLAGGIFAKKLQDVINPPPGTRFDLMPVYGHMFGHDKTLDALKALTQTVETELSAPASASAENTGTPLLRAALRFARHHSALQEQDGIILGASSSAQIDASLRACEEGPLPGSIVQAFETLWDACKDVAPPGWLPRDMRMPKMNGAR